MNVTIPQLLWYGNTELELDFPDSWSIYPCPMKGAYAPKLTDEEMAHAFGNPIGTPTIGEIAKGRKEAVIIFDDIARSTPVYAIAPYVIDALNGAGITDAHIRFVAALGAHGAHTANDFRKKLGEEVLDRFPVFNHNPFDFCTYVGQTSRGTPLSVNNEVMACDLKIGIGSIVPHPFCGFGGGAKIILPGVAHIDAINYNHGTILKNSPGSRGFGNIEGNVPRLDMEEAAKMARLDVKIDAIVNLRGEIAGLFVGDPILEHREGVKMAREFYGTVQAKDMDVVVLNAYSKSNEVVVTPRLGAPSIKEEGGDLVLIVNEPAGQVVHYLLGEFGTAGETKVGVTRPELRRVERMIAVMPLMDPFLQTFRNDVGEIVRVKTWQECLNLLKAKWGAKANVAVYPDATVQYFPLKAKTNT